MILMVENITFQVPESSSKSAVGCCRGFTLSRSWMESFICLSLAACKGEEVCLSMASQSERRVIASGQARALCMSWPIIGLTEHNTPAGSSCDEWSTTQAAEELANFKNKLLLSRWALNMLREITKAQNMASSILCPTRYQTSILHYIIADIIAKASCLRRNFPEQDRSSHLDTIQSIIYNISQLSQQMVLGRCSGDCQLWYMSFHLSR